MIRARRQLGEIEDQATHVPHDKPCWRVDRRQWIWCRSSRVVTVVHAENRKDEMSLPSMQYLRIDGTG